MVRQRFLVALPSLPLEPHLELLDGEVYETPSSEDAGLLDRLLSALASKATGRAQLWGQNPLRLFEESLPLPDPFLKTQAHPGPEEVLLGKVGLATEGGKKLPLYAEAGLEVHREPEEGRFPAARGERVAPL